MLYIELLRLLIGALLLSLGGQYWKISAQCLVPCLAVWRRFSLVLVMQNEKVYLGLYRSRKLFGKSMRAFSYAFHDLNPSGKQVLLG